MRPIEESTIEEGSVRKYIRDQELDELRSIARDYRRLCNQVQSLEKQVLDLTQSRLRGYVVRKAREFYWTTTRSLGLGHLHDGSSELKARRDVWVAQARRFFSVLPPQARDVASTDARRIYIDVTETTRCGHIAGSTRVVSKIAENASKHGGVPVFMQDGVLWTIDPANGAIRRVEPARGDYFLISDVSWYFMSDLLPIMERVGASGGSNVFLLYDLLPVIHPDLFPKGFDEDFGHRIDQVVERSDAVIAISECVAWDLVRHVRRRARPFKKDLRVGWAHLGSEIGSSTGGPPSATVAAICADDLPFFLIVSTVELRKGHAVALNAMERLWEAGLQARLVIVGRRGWHLQSTFDRILSHPEFGRRLVWIEKAPDDDLRHLYIRAHVSIYPSVAEGFGLPIVEAAAFGLQVIASDIAVFREIASDNVTFFDVADDAALADRLRNALTRPKQKTRAKTITWPEAVDTLCALVRSGEYQLGRYEDAASR